MSSHFLCDPCARWFRRLCDPKKTFLHRPLREIFLLVLFYVCFVSTVLGIACLVIYVTILNIDRYDRPWLRLDESLIGEAPGIGFRPILHYGSPVIWYKWVSDEMYYTSYVQALQIFLGEYELADTSGYRPCGDEMRSVPDKPCYFNTSLLHPCDGPDFGYSDMKPCVLLKMNKIYDWKPHCYTQPAEMPTEMPSDLKQYILDLPPEKRNMIWVDCKGYHPADTEHMGNITYHPARGFSAAYFPFVGQSRYLSPLIAVKFHNVSEDLLITIKCRAWAHNIEIGKKGGGIALFQLMIGSPLKRRVPWRDVEAL